MPTIYDVAELAGVSHTAVSAVINKKPIRMKDTTRLRILAAAETLGYQTNRVAQQLSTGKSNTLALCFAGTGSYIFKSPTTNQLVAGVVNCASENGLCLLLAPTKRVYTFEETLAKLPSQGVDGAVIIGPIHLPGDSASVISRCSVPVVCIDAHPGLSSTSTVDSDSFAGVRMGVEQLIALGHRKMAYIGPTLEFQCFVDRMRGFYQAVQDAGLCLADQMTHVVPLSDVPAVVRQSVAVENGPTALVCAEEETTRAVLDEVVRLGLRVPDDLSVMGYDDVPGHPLSEVTNIVRNNFFGMGEAAVDLLRKLINGECSDPVALRLTPDLVMRER